MIVSLQKKFIRTAMAAVTVLMLLMLGGINLVNILMVDQQVERNLEMIADNEGVMPSVPMGRPQDFWGDPKNDYDIFMASNFFVVRFDENGRIVYTDLSRGTSVTQEKAREMALQVLQKQKAQGRVGVYRYELRDSRMMPGQVAVFLDASWESASYGRVLLLSMSIGAVCWLLMLLLVRILSRRVIRPIEENILRQKQFVTNAGHEIKTPLAIIQANTEALELYNGENKWSRNIRAQVLRLTGLTNDLLSLSRMDEGNQIALTAVELSPLVHEVADGFEETLQLRHIMFQRDVAEGVLIQGSREKLSQLLSIILENAVKYTNDDGKVQLSLKKAEKSVYLSVKNTVDELPQVSPGKLFDRFYRADTARTQSSGGYGIGLSVAQAIAENHGGKLTASYCGDREICFTAEFRIQR